MRISINEVLELEPLYTIIKTKVIPMATSYKLVKLFKAVEEHQKFYEDQIRLLIEAYGEKDENGQFVQGENYGIKIQPDKIKECEGRIKELTDLKVDVPDVSFDFEELETLELTLEQSMKLMEFCKEEKADQT